MSGDVASDRAQGTRPARRRRHRLWLFVSIARESLPALVFVALVVAWWAAVAVLKVPTFVLPPPQDVLPRIWESRVSLTGHSLVTIQEIVMGFGLSVVTAIPMGLLIALSPTAKRMLYPLLVFIQRCRRSRSHRCSWSGSASDSPRR